jgi:hypothetical protein
VASLPAHLVATPVLERLTGGFERQGPVAGVVLGAGATAAWVDLGGFVIAITTREVPLLPNAIALSAGSGALSHPGVTPGATADLSLGLMTLGPLGITWDPATPPSWDPTVPVPSGMTQEEVAARGAAILHAIGSRPPTADPSTLVRGLGRAGLVTAADPDGAAGLTLLFRAVRDRDPEPAAAAARALLGRGPGLTPEGDDLLAAVAGTLAVLGPATGRLEPTRHPSPHGSGRHRQPRPPTLTPLLDALAPTSGRTTALSATLLTLASRRRLPEPAGRLLDFGPAAGASWPAALERLDRLGHGSGRAYAAGIGATAVLLAAGAGVG